MTTGELTDTEAEALAVWYERMSPEQQRGFWQVTGGRADKLAYLLRWGSFELGAIPGSRRLA